MDNERRHFLQAAAAALAASPWLAQAAQPAAAEPAPSHDMSHVPAHWTGSEQIGMLLYPGCTALDFVGPQYLFASLMGATVHHVAATLEPVTSDTGLGLVPTVTLADCPRDLDVLFVPGGGQGTLAAMRDEALLAFVADRGSRARWVTSVCTGSLVLGAAGLLKGYRATSHWVALGLLAEAGATPVDERVVRDRNRLTGAGVSAGLDLGLSLVEILRDRLYAQSVQLLAEYAPQPPFNAGTPKTAPAEATALMRDMFTGFVRDGRQILKDRRSRG
ncbi:DJ-1/PfpI family protein [Sphaerotilus mobilis]|uniref:DJ-1/PfpI family protein n=1 Tax=Sphaerotilus mobilis TaxID=47994 RepID=A0A4Q7LJW2_9BURK|nr:DJ-1/PfpI family protein [Sphaerotilus mobilis]RZS54906.1 DJ-1/PfpI family protein [Sphaerotilus mobilis]